METIIVKAKSKRIAEEVVKKLRKIQGLKVETSQTWIELDNSLPDLQISDEEIMKEVRAVRYGKEA